MCRCGCGCGCGCGCVWGYGCGAGMKVYFVLLPISAIVRPLLRKGMAHTHTHTHTYIHAYTHMHTHTYIHAYTHTHTPSQHFVATARFPLQVRDFPPTLYGCQLCACSSLKAAAARGELSVAACAVNMVQICRSPCLRV